ncbi:hypothetical protein [Mesorhizobium sp. LCM 4576]|uniref:hypothetical protein n=1 Tax=Mesorhizobium sp. LCM 4576 TaxID=1848289 RepID=UPI001041C784|nr:hypothetical protein [Mesorhizobium sp. LCM 4576]
MTAERIKPQMKDKELTEFATRFLTAYAASAQSGNGDPANYEGKSALFIRSEGPGGIVEITDGIAQAQGGFVHRAATLLKSKAGHEKAISEIGIDHAHDFIAGDGPVQNAVTAMIKAVFEQADASFEYLAPNYLIKLDPAAV